MKFAFATRNRGAALGGLALAATALVVEDAVAANFAGPPGPIDVVTFPLRLDCPARSAECPRVSRPASDPV